MIKWGRLSFISLALFVVFGMFGWMWAEAFDGQYQWVSYIISGAGGFLTAAVTTDWWLE